MENKYEKNGVIITSKRGLLAKSIKWIAMITMIIDHAATAVIIPLINFRYFVVLPLDQIYQAILIIEKLGFPLFVYLAVIV